MSEWATGFVPFLLIVVPIVVLSAQYLDRYLYGYRLSDGSIEIVLFNVVPINRIRYDRITGIRSISSGRMWLDLDLFVVRFGNRVWGPGVLIFRKRWLPIVITPDNAEELVREVRERVYRATGEWPLAS
jgi:hypothetical protein